MKPGWVPVAGLLAAAGLLAGFPGNAEPQGPEPAAVEILVAGDVYPRGMKAPWAAVRERFAEADLVFINLEAPITQRSLATPHKSRRALAAGRDFLMRLEDPALAEEMRAAGVGLAGLANNHAVDFREAGLRDTLTYLERAGVGWVGAGPDEAAALAPYLFEKNGIRVALLAFSDVVPAYFWAASGKAGIASSKEPERMVRAIQAARTQAEHVVVMMHWGEHLSAQPTARQRELGRLAVSAGAEVVVGMHPHVLQGTEWVEAAGDRRGIIFYSIGNFAFKLKRRPSQPSAVARLLFSKRGLEEASLLPLELSAEGVPRWVEGEPRGEEILAYLGQLSAEFHTQVDAAGRLGPALAARSTPDGAPPGESERQARTVETEPEDE